MSYGSFDLILDKDKCKCPMCHKYVAPKTCGFNNCSYRFTGIKLINGETQRFVSDKWIEVENKYQYYDPTTSGEVIWIQLKIH